MLQKKLLSESDSLSYKELAWKTHDGKELYSQCWHAGKKMRAGILLVHGLGEHSSRYDHWASQFAENGFSVLSFDIRGHGKTPGIPAKTPNYKVLLDDIELLIQKGLELCKGKPLYLYGHSFGGNLIINYVISRKLLPDGLILTSPWLELSTMPPRYKHLVAGILSRFLPGIRASSGLKPEHISRELREVHKYKKDPYIHNKISVGLFMKAYENGLIAKRSIYKINVPILVMHGSADHITSCKASREFVMNAGKKTTYVEVEGGYHELHNDSEKETVFTTILNWLNHQLIQRNA
jgi:alpha-beta hydrolase superfamily lysophospholipase